MMQLRILEKPGVPIYVIDPADMPILGKENVTYIKEVATKGVTELVEQLMKDEIITYKYKDKPYKISHESKMKLNGVWIDVIIYECLYENPDGMIWVRKKEEFFKLFTKI